MPTARVAAMIKHARAFVRAHEIVGHDQIQRLKIKERRQAALQDGGGLYLQAVSSTEAEGASSVSPCERNVPAPGSIAT